MRVFSDQHWLMVSLWSLGDSKSPQVSRTILRILPDLNTSVVWVVSTRALISKSSSPCTKLLMTVPGAPITIGITVTFIFHSFFSSLARSWYLSFFSHYFSFILWSAGTAKSTVRQLLFFFVDYHYVWSFSRDYYYYYYYYYTHLSAFFHQRKRMVFHWSVSDSKSPQVSKTLLRILANLNNAVV